MPDGDHPTGWLQNGGAAVFAAAMALGSSPAIAQQQASYYGPHMMWDGGWYGMIFGPLFMILILAAAIAAAVLLARWIGGPWYAAQLPVQTPPGRAPLDILKERFARGEIDKEEFEERRRVLGD